MTPTIYMLYVSGRAHLWQVLERDDEAAKEKSRKILADSSMPFGRLFTGPTGVDEMKFVDLVTK